MRLRATYVERRVERSRNRSSAEHTTIRTCVRTPHVSDAAAMDDLAQLARALAGAGHPTRLRLPLLLQEGETSPRRAADQLGDVALGNTAHHFRRRALLSADPDRLVLSLVDALAGWFH